MALPVLAGPFRCALIYNHEKQPLIELSLRVSLPLVDLLRALSQVAPPVGVKEPKAQRPPAKAPGGDTQRGYPSGSPTPSGNWRGYPLLPECQAVKRQHGTTHMGNKQVTRGNPGNPVPLHQLHQTRGHTPAH